MTESGAASGPAERATAAALLDAAEHAFAERGIEHASLRAIMRAAGANTAAVHYHFGSRQSLATAVLDRTLRPLNERRLALLGQAEARAADHRSVPLAELLDALIRPDLEVVAELDARSPGRGRLVGTIYSRPERFVKALVEQNFEPVATRFMPHLITALPAVPAGELAWRVRWCVFGLLGALLCEGELDLGPTGDPGSDAPRLERAVAHLVTVTSGALSSPPTGGSDL